VIYLSGAIRKELVGMDRMGFLITPKGGHRPDLSTMPWAADSGCYSTPYIGDDSYLRFLDSYPRDTCLFAVAPDVVADWSGTVKVAAAVLPKIRAMGFPAAFIAQDDLPPAWVAWDEFDALFVGGTTAYKLSEDAYALVREAKRRGKWCHMGRVNSLRRLQAAAMGGYDSVDGTYLAFGPDVNLVRLRGWLDALSRQPTIFAKGGR
jgi:hypothetical protein